MATATESGEEKVTFKDFKSDNEVRWCPGCGDYAILNVIQKTFPKLGVEKENFVVVSGIGCSSRFPYYMNTYGFHTVHGRAPSVATGIKTANPDLSVWQITGDGDALSIGANHLLHILRRNVDVNILLFNNRVYGLTKGQYSPTSPSGMKTKSTPMGSLDHPINPLLFAIGAEATFIARTMDNDPKHMGAVFEAAHKHKGTSFVEIFQNCVIFNNGVWEDSYNRKTRNDTMLFLEEGQPLLFGKEKDKGIAMKGLKPTVVDTSSEVGDDVVVHNPTDPDSLYTSMLANLTHPEYPVPVGVLRSVERPVYNDQVDEQIEAAIEKKGPGDLEQLLTGDASWEVE